MGKTIKWNYNKNPHQKEFHNDILTRKLHLSGGYGCMREDTLINTINGLVEFGSINKPTYYLSHHPEHGLVYSLGTAAYPKQKDDLYRVVHTHGEFVASLSHVLFCADYKYRPLGELSVGASLLSVSSDHAQTNLALCPSMFLEDDHHCLQTAANYQGDYSSYCHQYDQPLHPSQGNVLAFSPSHNGVRTFDDSSCQVMPFSRSDDQVAHLSTHSHLDQQYGHSYMMDSDVRLLLPALGVADHASIGSSAHTSAGNQQLQKSLLMCDVHRSIHESNQHCTSFGTSSPITTIKSIEKIAHDWVWDTHVYGTNNYVAHGAVHHNSGKSYALAMKTFQLSFLNRPYPGGFLSPTYGEFKKDMLLIFEEMLDAHKITYRFNKQDFWFQFPWSEGKVFIHSGERKLRGPNWGFACINELTLIPLERYLEVLGRVRVKSAKYPQIASVGTPEGMANDYYDYLIENPKPGTRVIYGSTQDNLDNLSEYYIDDISASYDSVMQQAYLEGQWVNMNSNQFYYAYDPKRNNFEHIKNEWDWFHVGMDFNVNPMAASIWQWDGVRLKGIEEIELKNADTKAMAMALMARGYTPDNTIIYPDPSGNNRSTKGDPDIEILRRCGYQEIRVKKKAPGFRQRQLHMNNLLEKGVIQANPKTQPLMCRDLLSVEQNVVTLEKVKKNQKLTHFSDGLDYLCDVLIQWKPRPPGAFQGVRQ